MNTQTHPGEIDRLRAVTLAVTDLTRSLAFYTEVWGLEPVHRRDDTVFLRAAGTDHHVLVLQQADRPRLVSMTFGTASVESLHALHARLVAAGVATEGAPRALASPGGGFGFAFRDPDGRTFKVVADREDRAEAQPAANRPVRLAHVVLNTADLAATAGFLTEVLRFRTSDRTAKMQFLRCGPDHHVVAVCDDGNVSMNHLAFEMASWNELMFGVGRLKEAGHRVQWGVGRHGPGDNVFAYFLDPDGFAVEYTAEVQQIDERTWVPGGPEKWVRPPNRMDQWGHSDLPTAALKEAMHGASQARAVREVPR